MHSENYKTRLDNAYIKYRDTLLKLFPDMEEDSELISDFTSAITACEEVYMEIGIKVGIILANEFKNIEIWTFNTYNSVRYIGNMYYFSFELVEWCLSSPKTMVLYHENNAKSSIRNWQDTHFVRQNTISRKKIPNTLITSIFH